MFKSYDQVNRFQYLFCYKPYVLVCFGVLHIEWSAKLRNDCKCFILEVFWFSVFETFVLCVWWIITNLRDSEEFEWDDQILPMCSNTCKPVPVFFCLCIITEEWIWMYWKYVLTWYTIIALRLPVLWPYSVECNKYSLTFEWDFSFTHDPKIPPLGGWYTQLWGTSSDFFFLPHCHCRSCVSMHICFFLVCVIHLEICWFWI